MQSAQHFSHIAFKHCQQVFTLSTLCLSLMLSACQKNDSTTPVAQSKKIELIQQDLVALKDGTAMDKTAFTGTIRAVNQSTVQAQVTATASNVYVQVGQTVAKGQVLVHLNNPDNAARLAQAKANLASAQAQSNQANIMVQRKQRLLKQGFISQVEFEQSRVDHQAQVENVRAMQANVDIANKAQQDGTLVSPIRGVITQRQVEPGQTVAAGQTLFEIVDAELLEIQAKLPSDMQAALRIGQKIEYRIQGNDQALTAVVSRISPIADQASRQIEFFATLNQVIPTLSIGAFVEGQLLGSNAISGQMIPLDTIHDIQTKPYVWVIRQNKIARVPIQILQQRYNNNIAIVQGLTTGDLISRIKFNEADIQQPVSISTH